MRRASTRPMVLTLVRRQRHYYLRHADEVARSRLHSRVGEEALDLVAHERLLLEQRARDTVERRAVLAQQAHGLGEGVIRETRLLAVAEPLRLLRQRVVVRAHR